MSKIQDIQAQIATLQAQLEQVRQAETQGAIDKVRALVQEFNLSEKDIFGASKQKKPASKRGEVAAKYKDPVSGKTWSGRGLTPKWLAGANKADFEIKSKA